MSTEARNPRSYGLDKMTAEEIMRLMDEEEHVVFRVVKSAGPLLAQAAEKVAQTFMSGGRVIYVGAGTSGRIATMDAAEMPPTFGIDPVCFQAIAAGGDIAKYASIEDAEDDEHAALMALNEIKLSRRDVVFGLAASGRTPFVVAAVKHAKQKGAWTCGIANNKRSPLLEVCDLPILLDTGPEVLTGSTRLKAGTAQKMALNRISTAAMVLSGKVIENLMVDLHSGNAKLRDRSVRIVQDLMAVTADEARNLLERNDWSIRQVMDAVHASPKS